MFPVVKNVAKAMFVFRRKFSFLTVAGLLFCGTGVFAATLTTPNINTANVIPPRYVNKMTVRRGGELVFDMDGTFSISTNPNFRFTFGRGADNSLDVAITDTDGTKFTAQSEPSGS